MKTLFFLLLFLIVTSLPAQVYQPPNYAFASHLQGTSYTLDMGFKEYNRDYYVVMNPLLHIPLFGLRVGLQIPLEILIYDREPKTASRVPSLRPGIYDKTDDYFKFIKYISYGTHLYYDPEDTFNWSLYYGVLTDGYIGHRTIINRYVSSYDPSVWSPGLMADINNNWGGIEIFASNVFRREVRGYRMFIRPVGIYNGLSSLAGYQKEDTRTLAHHEGYLLQTIPDAGKGGSLRQYLHRTLKEDLEETELEFREVYNPRTGEVEIKAFPREKERKDTLPKTSGEEQKKDEKTTPKHGFWNRWAIGYTVVTDYGAPLSLEFDGSGNIVIDPETKLPRADKRENLTIVGLDTELRLSPFRWMEMTPYIDINTIKNLRKSKGTHIGVLFEIKIARIITFTLRPEYREITSNYIPEYFDSTYAVERTSYLAPNSQYTPKLAYLKSLPSDGDILKGYFLNSTLELSSFLFLELTYENYEGPNNSEVFVGFFIPNINGLFLNGYYVKKYFDKWEEAFKINENSLLAGEIGISFIGGFYIKYVLQRTWTFDKETNEYSPKDETTIGFGYASTI